MKYTTTALMKLQKEIYQYYAEGALSLEEADKLIEQAKKRQEEVVQEYTKALHNVILVSLLN